MAVPLVSDTLLPLEQIGDSEAACLSDEDLLGAEEEMASMIVDVDDKMEAVETGAQQGVTILSEGDILEEAHGVREGAEEDLVSDNYGKHKAK